MMTDCVVANFEIGRSRFWLVLMLVIFVSELICSAMPGRHCLLEG